MVGGVTNALGLGLGGLSPWERRVLRNSQGEMSAITTTRHGQDHDAANNILLLQGSPGEAAPWV